MGIHTELQYQTIYPVQYLLLFPLEIFNDWFGPRLHTGRQLIIPSKIKNILRLKILFWARALLELFLIHTIVFEIRISPQMKITSPI